MRIGRLGLLFTQLIFALNIFGQTIQKDELTKKKKLYWDLKNKHLMAEGAYYKNNLGIQFNKEERHGLWKFYSKEGELEEERMYYRNRIHGKQNKFHLNGALKSEAYFTFNVPDSIYKEFNEKGVLIAIGSFDLGSPIGEWKYYYEDKHPKSTELIRNDTIYTMEYWTPDSLHEKTIIQGEGFINNYFQSGKIKESYSFKNGLKNGLFIERTANGQTTVSGQFENGLKMGEWKFYHFSGVLEKIINFNQDKLDGSYKVYYRDGTINTEGQYENGEKSGTWYWNFEDGKIEMKGDFYKNNQNGAWIFNFPSGQRSYNANFKNGSKDGLWEYFYVNGEKYKKGIFLNNKKEGVWTTWYENGNVLMEGSYKNGKEQGIWKNYWENGNLKNKSNFKKGNLHGRWYSYNLNQILIVSGNYRDGLKSGKWVDYFDNGRLMKKSAYRIIKRKNEINGVTKYGMKRKLSEFHGKFEAYSPDDYFLQAKGKFNKGQKHGTWIDFYPGGNIPNTISQFKNGNLHGYMRRFDRRGRILSDTYFKDGKKDGWFVIFGTNGKIKVKKYFRNGKEVLRKQNDNLFSP